MIKHGKVHKFIKRAPTHLEPIAHYITKGVADAMEKVILHPRRCDIKGAKRYNGQECVIARTLDREMGPEAIAVGRAYTYVVEGGVAKRFRNPTDTTRYQDVFDENGVAAIMPVELLPPHPNKRLRPSKPHRPGAHRQSQKTRRAPMKKIGVRAIGGGRTR